MSLPSIILFMLVIFSTISLAHSKSPRLGIFSKMPRNAPDSQRQQVGHVSTDSDHQVFYFNQTLDHFTFTPESYTKFQQKYVVDAKHWGGSNTNSPILVYLGAEAALDYQLPGIGFLRDNSPRLKALLVYIEVLRYEHAIWIRERSVKKCAFFGVLECWTSTGGLCHDSPTCEEGIFNQAQPIIVIGGSYGGMLAAWFKLKYPHIALGALASSAPILYFEDTRPKHGYYYIVTKVFEETSESCYNTIRKSWEEIDRIAAKPNGLLILRKKFRICNPLNGAFDLKDFLDSLYAVAAQYNGNDPTLVAVVCEAINTSSSKEDLLDQIFAGVVALKGNTTCYDISEQPTADDMAWMWQSCSEMVMPIGHDEEDKMFQAEPYNMTRKIENCESQYGVPPRPYWATTYFGIQDIKLILKEFGSNIIFSNGLLDPYSVGGVLEDISATVVALTTSEGSHCQDIVIKRNQDPDWLVMLREKETKIIESWILRYKKSLKDLNITA